MLKTAIVKEVTSNKKVLVNVVNGENNVEVEGSENYINSIETALNEEIVVLQFDDETKKINEMGELL